MSDRELPEEVRRFLEEHIDAYEQLEVLLLLHGERRVLSPGEVAATLRIDLGAVETAALRLTERGLLRGSGEAGRFFEYAPSGSELGPIVDRLARIYREDRVTLLRTMNASAVERMRRAALQAFADAFRLRKPGRRG